MFMFKLNKCSIRSITLIKPNQPISNRLIRLFLPLDGHLRSVPQPSRARPATNARGVGATQYDWAGGVCTGVCQGNQ